MAHFRPSSSQPTTLVLVQDNDPQVLYSLLKNPRITVDEVVRVAKSAYLTYQTAELILKTSQWTANLDVRLSLIHNPKTPPTFALRILLMLPEAEVKVIARGAATSMALKQAALKRLQGGGSARRASGKDARPRGWLAGPTRTVPRPAGEGVV